MLAAQQTAMGDAFRAAGVRSSVDEAAMKAEKLLEEACLRPISGSDRIAYVLGGLLGDATHYIMVTAPFRKFLDQSIGYLLSQTLKDMKVAAAEKQRAAANGKSTESGSASDVSPENEDGRARAAAEPSGNAPGHSQDSSPPSGGASEPIAGSAAAAKQPYKPPLDGVDAFVTAEIHKVAARKSYLDIKIGGQVLYNMPVGRALRLAHKKEHQALVRLDVNAQEVHHSIFVKKVCSGAHDRSKLTSFYWPDKHSPELYLLWERAGSEAMATMTQRIAEHVAPVYPA